MSLILLSLISFISHSARYDQILERMKTLDQSPQVSIFDFTTNDQGTVIKGLKIGEFSDDKVESLVVAVHHGNELLSAEVAMETAKKLDQAMSDVNSPWHSKVKDRVFTIIPVLNISGYNINRREEQDAKKIWRDPNRDYQDACLKKTDFYLKSTRDMANYLKNSSIVSAVTIHGYIGTMTYPWGMFTENYKTADHEAYNEITKKATAHNGYHYGTHGDVVYPAVGTFEDWSYHTLGIWTTLLEIERNLNLSNDADAVIEFLVSTPKVRSKNHQMTARCLDQNLIRANDIGRP